jgi:NADH:ubiquinone reductase (non-electrogenic)
VGTIELRSIMQPIRYFTRRKYREVRFVEGDCTQIDPSKNQILVQGTIHCLNVSYD